MGLQRVRHDWGTITFISSGPSQVVLVVKNLPANAGDLGSIPGSGRFPGEMNGNPLQYSCLENPMDRGVWQATVHGVAKRHDWSNLARTDLNGTIIPGIVSLMVGKFSGLRVFSGIIFSVQNKKKWHINFVSQFWWDKQILKHNLVAWESSEKLVFDLKRNNRAGVISDHWMYKIL